MLDNAIRYTPKGGKIYVELFTERDRLNFKVKDSGIGIPKSEQPRLFSKMFRATNAKSIRPDGTGLGLYLARKIVLGHGGHVIFTTDQGLGSYLVLRCLRNSDQVSLVETRVNLGSEYANLRSNLLNN